MSKTDESTVATYEKLWKPDHRIAIIISNPCLIRTKRISFSSCNFPSNLNNNRSSCWSNIDRHPWIKNRGKQAREQRRVRQKRTSSRWTEDTWSLVSGVEGVKPRNERIRDVPRGQQPTRRVAVDVLAMLSFTVRSLSLSVSRNQKAQTSTNKDTPPPLRCPCEIETRHERSRGARARSRSTPPPTFHLPSFLYSALFRHLIAVASFGKTDN